MKKLLFVTSTRLGDAVLSTSVLQHWLQQHPDGRAIVACGAVPAPLFRACPQVEAVLPMVKGRHARHWRQLWRHTAGTRWHSVIDLRGSALGWMLLARQRYIFRAPPAAIHKHEQFQSFLGQQTLPLPAIWVDETARRQAAAVQPAAPFLVIGATANWRGKQWPAERFAETALLLTAADGVLPDAPIVLVAAPNEHEQLQPLVERLPAERTTVLAGTLSLPALAALLQQAALYIGNDSGLMHLAAAAGAPTLGLFGPSDERVYAPLGARTAWARTPQSMAELTAAPDYDHRTTGSLMAGLAVETVVQAAARLYQQSL